MVGDEVDSIVEVLTAMEFSFILIVLLFTVDADGSEIFGSISLTSSTEIFIV